MVTGVLLSGSKFVPRLMYPGEAPAPPVSVTWPVLEVSETSVAPAGTILALLSPTESAREELLKLQR